MRNIDGEIAAAYVHKRMAALKAPEWLTRLQAECDNGFFEFSRFLDDNPDAPRAEVEAFAKTFMAERARTQTQQKAVHDRQLQEKLGSTPEQVSHYERWSAPTRIR